MGTVDKSENLKLWRTFLICNSITKIILTRLDFKCRCFKWKSSSNTTDTQGKSEHRLNFRRFPHYSINRILKVEKSFTAFLTEKDLLKKCMINIDDKLSSYN